MTDLKATPQPTPVIFFHSTPEAPGPSLIVETACGVRGWVEIAQLAKVEPGDSPGLHRLIFDDKSAIEITSPEMERVARALHDYTERLLRLRDGDFRVGDLTSTEWTPPDLSSPAMTPTTRRFQIGPYCDEDEAETVVIEQSEASL